MTESGTVRQSQRSPSYALELSDAERMRFHAMAKRALEHEGERWRRYGVVAGARVADIGCGPGAVLVLLGQLVGPEGTAVGVEPDASARAAALEEIHGAGLENTSVVTGDGEATTLDPESYDLVMIRHVLCHVGGAALAVLRHASSLLRPGGHVYLVDNDATARRFSVDDADVVDASNRYTEYQRDRGNNVDIGPRLAALLVEAGLEVLEHEGWFTRVPARMLMVGGPLVAARHEMLAAGALSPDDVRRHDGAMARLAAIPHAAMFIASFLAVGRKAGAA